MEKMNYYNQGKVVPPEAKSTIAAGRLKGKTDINPMWRIKKLTEMFGPCGIGWYVEIKRSWTEQFVDEVTANIEIALYVKTDDWSKPIVGVGGSHFVSQEKNGAYVDDDCYKKALTDAISVACKMLGIGADVYFSGDTSSKYSEVETSPRKEPKQETVREMEIRELLKGCVDVRITPETIKLWILKKTKDPTATLNTLSDNDYAELVQSMMKAK